MFTFAFAGLPVTDKQAHTTLRRKRKVKQVLDLSVSGTSGVILSRQLKDENLSVFLWRLVSGICLRAGIQHGTKEGKDWTEESQESR